MQGSGQPFFTPATQGSRRPAVSRDHATTSRGLSSGTDERAAAAPGKQASPKLPHRFAEALEEWANENLNGPPDVEKLLQLLRTYEEICEVPIRELKQRAEDALARHRPAEAAAFSAEAELLHGEQGSWRLLQEIFADWGTRQQRPPPYPDRPEDWGASLRAFGPPAPYLDVEMALARAREVEKIASTESHLSRIAAESGPKVRLLHDECVQELAICRADPLLLLGQSIIAWLERATYERIKGKHVQQDCTPLRTIERQRVCACRRAHVHEPTRAVEGSE